MNFAKRAFLSITRRKGRALILFAVVFILGNLIAGAISIQQATQNVEKSIKKQLGGTASIEVDMKVYEDAMSSGEKVEIEPLKEDLIKQIGSSNYVKYYDYNMETYGGAKDIKAFAPPKEGNEMISGEMKGLDFALKGVQYAPIMDIKEKKAKLADGRVFTEEEIEKGSNVGLISKKLAEENNLSVGDTFIFQSNVFDFGTTYDPNAEPIATRDVPIEIIGIFEPLEAEKKTDDETKKADPMASFYNTQFQNTLYVPNGVVSKESTFKTEELMKVNPDASEEASYLPKFVLKSPESVDAFKEETNPLVPKNYKLSASTDQYNAIAAPIKSMSKLSGYVLVAAIGASLLIVSLVVLLFLRDRKHEFGIYLSLGEKRQRVLGQVIIEVLVVAFIAIGLSVFSGNYLAKGISSSMIQNQIQAEAEKEEAGSSSGMVMIAGSDPNTSSLSAEGVTKEYQVSLSSKYVISFFVIGLGTILVATIAPMVYLIRLNPKKIMM
ncbi:ABC transporter permease [uncultured Vagococcus sp.]|uniref:ABC transporter permease n=1 Tax=uncultured Vagococcus sp. TaxID=189676 RepID=UPI0028D37A5B|nr:ABC transporter permease [uncultured Vagococcus sp.]